MSRVFITDEVNDDNSLKIYNTGAGRVQRSTTYYNVPSAAVTSGVITTSPCWLNSVVFTQTSAATAGQFILVNAGTSAQAGILICVTSSAYKIADWAMAATSGLGMAGNYDFDSYCNQGLTYCLSAGANKGIVVTYTVDG